MSGREASADRSLSQHRYRHNSVALNSNHDAKRAALALDLLLILILSAPSNHAGGLRAHRAQARCRVVGQERFAYF
ncbi:hypothetical protein E1K68_18095 [Pseudomonas sp. B2021]|nr:hypothetical protein [Pseudomonas sp. B2021]